MLILALVSLGMAAVLGFVTWRLWVDDRRRSEARVAALASAIDGPAVAAASVPTLSLFEHVASPRPQAAPALELSVGAPVAATGHGAALLKIAIGFLAVVGVIVAIAMMSDRGPAVTPVAATVDTSPALELISMRHTRSGSNLTVTGLVRNPGAGARDRLIAVVLAFDRAGDFVASGRAPLEFPVLATGDESPFQVTIPNVTDLGRYRVSFRTETGVVRHVDKRTARAAQGV